MAPILGILASGISGNLWQPGKDYDSIATVNVSSPVSSISFTSIPATYRHLQIRMFSNAGSNDIFYQFNGDTATNYTRHYLYGTGASALAGGSSANPSGSLGYTAPTANTNVFGATIFDVLDYTNTSKNTTTRSLGGFDANGSGFSIMYSGLWVNTSAVSSIRLYLDSGNFNQYTQAALYGIR
jgi:hypothetical protein